MGAEIIVNHVVISLVSWLIGGAIGSGLGAIYALLLRRILTSNPGLQRVATLFPWRTMVVGLLLLIWSPIIPLKLGIGAVSTSIVVGLTVFLLALPITAASMMDHWKPQPLRVHLVAMARNLAMISMVAAVWAGLLTGGGAGPYLIEQANLLQFDQAIRGWLIVVVVAMIVDILLGIVQNTFSNNQEPMPSMQQAVSGLGNR